MDNAIPRYMYNRITDIEPSDLLEMGVRAIAIDLDNTTVYDSTARPLEGVLPWLESVKQVGIRVCIVSNTYPLRARHFSKKFGVPAFSMANKPKPDKLIKAANKLGVDISEMAMIGDQLFADVLAANSCGAISIKTEPFMKEKLFAKKFRERRERERVYVKDNFEKFKNEKIHSFMNRRKGEKNDSN